MSHIFFRAAAVILVLLFWADLLNAQLAGNYTMGGTSPDYLTIQEAVDSLES